MSSSPSRCARARIRHATIAPSRIARSVLGRIPGSLAITGAIVGPRFCATVAQMGEPIEARPYVWLGVRGGRPAARLRPVTDADLDLVVLGGGGHVGLPLALAFADSGWKVKVYDIDGAKLERIKQGEMPFREEGADELLPKVLATGRLTFASDPTMIER